MIRHFREVNLDLLALFQEYRKFCAIWHPYEPSILDCHAHCGRSYIGFTFLLPSRSWQAQLPLVNFASSAPPRHLPFCNNNNNREHSPWLPREILSYCAWRIRSWIFRVSGESIAAIILTVLPTRLSTMLIWEDFWLTASYTAMRNCSRNMA